MALIDPSKTWIYPPIPARACDVCGVTAPIEGPLDWRWDVHTVPGERAMKLSCSPECRTQKGWLERRVRPG